MYTYKIYRDAEHVQCAYTKHLFIIIIIFDCVVVIAVVVTKCSTFILKKKKTHIHSCALFSGSGSL